MEVIEGEAELLATLAQGVGYFRVLEQRLRGDAAHVQAHAAQPLFIYDGSFQAKLRRADGSHISTRPGPNHNNIIRISHVNLLEIINGFLILMPNAANSCRNRT
jgi:hypothetical protein